MLHPSEGYLNISDTKVWYRIAGRGDRLPILLLHGGPGAPSYYLNPLGELAADRPVIFFDQPGCGRSGGVADISRLNIEYFVDVVEQLCRHLGLSRFYLYGQSWGALLALEYYLKHPGHIQAMILSSPLISTPAWIKDAGLLIKTLPVQVQDAINTHEAAGSFDSPEYQQAIQVFYERFLARKQPWPEDLLQTFEQMGLEVYQHMWGPSEFTANGILKHHDRSHSLTAIQIPALYLCGEFDEARPETVRVFHHMTPGSKMHVVKDAAHMTMHDAPGKDVACIREFIDLVGGL